MLTASSGRPAGVDPELKQVAADALPALAMAMKSDAAAIPSRLSRGCRCLAAWLGSDLSAFCWVSTGSEWIGEIERGLTLADRECYVWNCVTLTPYRRQGLFRALVAHAASTARHDGFARAWIGNVVEAGPVHRALLDAGFNPVVRVDLFRLPGAGLVHLEPVAGADPEMVSAARSALAIRSWSAQARRSAKH